jgi:hypothetical protein
MVVSTLAYGPNFARILHTWVSYKADAAGNYAVNGVWPQANGYF